MPSPLRASAALVEDWGIIAGAGSAAMMSIHHAPVAVSCIVLPVAWTVIGGRMRALATMLHEASHRALARSTSAILRWLRHQSGHNPPACFVAS